MLIPVRRRRGGGRPRWAGARARVAGPTGGARPGAEAFDNDRCVAGQREEVLHDQVKPFAREPVEAVQHLLRWPVHPAVVHAHPLEGGKAGAAMRRTARGVILHGVVAGIEMRAVGLRQFPRKRRFACAAAAAQPADVGQGGAEMIGRIWAAHCGVVADLGRRIVNLFMYRVPCTGLCARSDWIMRTVRGDRAPYGSGLPSAVSALEMRINVSRATSSGRPCETTM